MVDDFKQIKRNRLPGIEKYLCDVFDNIVIVPFGDTTYYNYDGKVIFQKFKGGVSIKYGFRDDVYKKFKLEYNIINAMIRKYIKDYFEI